MGVFQKVGGWLTDKSDRFIRGEAGAPGSYYGSSEAEQMYGQMGQEPRQETDPSSDTASETSRYKALDPFDRAGKDYGGRVPYRSQRDMQAQHAALEAERQKQLREEQTRAYAPPPQQMQPGQAPQHSQQYVPQHAQPQGGYAQQPMAGRQQAQPPQTAQANNVVLFPGMHQTPEGGTCTHMEYIVLLRNRNECTKVIEYIKANASVFLNMEFIASDGERQRCVDMLSGAAYTLGCAFNKISPRGIYLISAPSVYVVIDPALQKFASGPEAQGFVRQNYEGGYGSAQRGGGYQAASAGYAAQGQATPRRPATSFGNVMAGNVTESYPAMAAFQTGPGRYPKKEYQ